MQVYPSSGESVLMLYDLRDSAAWKRAHREQKAWGKQFCTVFHLDEDHVVVEFLPGGALEASA